MTIERLTEPAGLYVHVPFCASRCRYCGFASGTDRGLIGPYLEALGREAAFRLPLFEGPFDTLHIGGGTPSVLSDDELAVLLDQVGEAARLEPLSEITLEANPDDVTSSRAQRWHELGFHRVSLGVQSLDDARLDWLGRRHTARAALRAIVALREAGSENLGVDLIIGLPDQDERALEAEIAALRPFGLEHVACYQLTAEPGTPIGESVRSGRVRLPDEDAQARLFEFADALLTAEGYDHYEVSNFGKTQGFRSRHNQKYWHHAPYLGLGPSAHSFWGRRRSWNVRTTADYLAALARPGLPEEGFEVLSADQLRLEAIALGLRTSDGIPALLIKPEIRAARVPRLQKTGLIMQRGDRLTPTLRGMLVADALARELS